MNESPDTVPENETTMEKVVKEIYSSCDPDNVNSVPVSKLIDFVKPFLLDSTLELQQLREKLDPDNNNPSIGRETFYAAMNEWTSSVKISDAGENTAEISCDNGWSLPFVQSTPRSSIGYCQLVKNCSEILGVSNIAAYEISDNGNTVSVDKAFLEEQVRQLQYQVQRTVNELVVVKQQLAAAEEQNESLLADLEKLAKNLQSEQQSKEQLRQNQIETDDYKENSLAANKRIEILEKTLATREKDHQNLLDEIKELESKKSYLEGKLEVARKQNGEAQKEIACMKNEIEAKESEISNWIKIVQEMKVASNEKEELIQFYSNESKLAKSKAATLEKVFCIRCPSQAEAFLNKISHIEQNGNVCNSPNLLNQTSLLFSPIIGLSKFGEATRSCSSPLRDEIDTNFPMSPINDGSLSPSINGIDRNESKLIMNVTSDDSKTSNSIFTNAFVAHSLRSPHKSLQEELCEALTRSQRTDSFKMRPPHNSIPLQNQLLESLNNYVFKIPGGTEDVVQQENGEGKVEHLQNQLSIQEDVNGDIWKNMWLLKSEVEKLSSYKQEYEQLEKTCEEQARMIDSLKNDQNKECKEIRKRCEEQERTLDAQNKDFERLKENCENQATIISELKASNVINRDYIEAHEELEKNFGEQQRTIGELRSWRSCHEVIVQEQLEVIQELKETLREVKESGALEVKKLLEEQDKLQETYLELEKKYLSLDEENRFLLETHKSLEKLLEDNNEELADARRILRTTMRKIKGCPEQDDSSDSVRKLLGCLQIAVDTILESRSSSCPAPKSLNDTVIENKRSSAFKLELKNEKLQERIEKLERDLQRERNAKSEFEKNRQELEQKITEELTEKYSIEFKESEENLHRTMQDLKESHSEMVNNIRMDLEEVAGVKDFLESENRILAQDCRNLKESLAVVQQQWNETKQKNEELVATLLQEKSITKAVREDNRQLLNRLQLLEATIKEKESMCDGLLEQLAALVPANNSLAAELQKISEERDSQAAEFQQQMRAAEMTQREFIEELRDFMTNNYKELCGSTSAVVACGNFCDEENDSVLKHLDEMSSDRDNISLPLKREMYELGHQIKLAMTLLEMVSNKWFEIRAPTLSRSESQNNLSINDKSRSEDEASFKSCCDQEDIPSYDALSHQSDSFLEDLELDNYGPRVLMSRREMDEKFAALALVFMIDCTTSKKRYLKQTERYARLVQKFNKYTTSAIVLLKNANSEGRLDSVITYLEMLKSVSSEIFVSAEQCGVLQHEIRNLKCWNFVSNYVAVLSRENRRMEQIGPQNDDNNDAKLKVLSCCRVNQYEYLPESNKIPSPAFRKGFFISFWFLTFLGCIVVLLFLYVQWECSTKFRHRVCPLDGVFEFCIHRTYTDHTF